MWGEAYRLSVKLQGLDQLVLLVDLVPLVTQPLTVDSVLDREIEVLPLEAGRKTFLQHELHAVLLKITRAERNI